MVRSAIQFTWMCSPKGLAETDLSVERGLDGLEASLAPVELTAAQGAEGKLRRVQVQLQERRSEHLVVENEPDKRLRLAVKLAWRHARAAPVAI